MHPFEMKSLGIFGRLDSLNPDGLTDWFMVGGCGVLFIVVFIGWVVSTKFDIRHPASLLEGFMSLMETMKPRRYVLLMAVKLDDESFDMLFIHVYPTFLVSLNSYPFL